MPSRRDAPTRHRHLARPLFEPWWPLCRAAASNTPSRVLSASKQGIERHYSRLFGISGVRCLSFPRQWPVWPICTVYGETRQIADVFIVAPSDCRLMNEDVHVPFIFHPRSSERRFFFPPPIYSPSHGKTSVQWNVLSNNTAYRFAACGEKTVWFSIIGENRETGEERSRDRMHSIVPYVRWIPVSENDI